MHTRNRRRICSMAETIYIDVVSERLTDNLPIDNTELAKDCLKAAEAFFESIFQTFGPKEEMMSENE